MAAEVSLVHAHSQLDIRFAEEDGNVPLKTFVSLGGFVVAPILLSSSCVLAVQRSLVHLLGRRQDRK